ncbi:MAG: arginyltransferase [Pseudomonadota bacterium]
MSIIKSPLGGLHPFFRSGPLPCAYLEGRIERKLFTRLSGPRAAALNSVLSQAGFRRSHDIIYRPVCPGCNACKPVRIPASRFKPSRTMRRVERRNNDLTASFGPAQPTSEQFDLFRRYQQDRHTDSEMARMSEADFAAMIEDGAESAEILELRDVKKDQLLGVMLADGLTDGFSAVYSFFDPDVPHRSLGTDLIMRLIGETNRRGQNHVYLGYWISGSRKMAYKASFQPLEILEDGVWRDLSSENRSD